MRNAKGQFAKGHKPPKSPGRPKKADEQILVDLWNDHGKKVLKKLFRTAKIGLLKNYWINCLLTKRQLRFLARMASQLNSALMMILLN